MNSNRIVQLAAVGLVLAVVMIVVIKNSKNSVSESDIDNPLAVAGGEPLSEDTLAAMGLEGDTEKDTVATLIGEVKKLRVDVGALNEENAGLREDNRKFKDMESSIQSRLRVEMREELNAEQTRQEQALDMRAAQTEQRVQGFLNRFKGGGGNQPGSGVGSQTYTGNGDGTVWVQSLDGGGGLSGGSPKKGMFGLLSRGRDAGNKLIDAKRVPGASGGTDALKPMVPVYTIPKNATLVGSTVLTALVGRVPVGTNVTDPYSFKVIIGKDNLAANGIEIPEVAYAVSSGKAVGDWTLGCVRGDLHSITFVFNDGTIRTVPKPGDIYEGAAASSQIKLGEISDRFGNPCVVGKRITNAYTYLTQRVGIMALGAAAEAAAASQTETSTSIGSGGVSSSTRITGSTSEYVLGRTVSDGTQEVANWLDQRQSQQFDAIYVAPGEAVAIHINEQIAIDYDPQGRKTQYAGMTAGGQYRALD